MASGSRAKRSFSSSLNTTSLRGRIHWGVRWYTSTCAQIFASSGTICAALAPVPITATRRPVRSCSSSQRAEWKDGPPKESQPLDLGQRRRGEGADGAHQNVRLVQPACVVGHHPTVAPLVPAGRLDPHARAQMGSDGEAIGALLEVAQDLGLRGVRLGPVGLEGEGIGVEMRRHVAGRSGVRVEPPGPAHAVSRLEQNEVAPARLGQRDGQPEATGAGADDGDLPVPDRIAHGRASVSDAMVACAAVSISSTRTPLGSCSTARRTGPTGATTGSPPSPSPARRGNTASRSA